jgi:hypothetical protein
MNKLEKFWLYVEGPLFSVVIWLTAISLFVGMFAVSLLDPFHFASALIGAISLPAAMVIGFFTREPLWERKYLKERGKSFLFGVYVIETCKTCDQEYYLGCMEVNPYRPLCPSCQVADLHREQFKETWEKIGDPIEERLEKIENIGWLVANDYPCLTCPSYAKCLTVGVSLGD